MIFNIVKNTLCVSAVSPVPTEARVVFKFYLETFMLILSALSSTPSAFSRTAFLRGHSVNSFC